MPVGEKALSELEVLDTSYPAESREMLIWTIACTAPAAYTVEISYFTSGISWAAEYIGVLTPDERAMDLTAYVTVANHSGEEYDNAKVRLVVGTINLVERIVDLAQGGPRPPAMPMPQDEQRALERMARDGGGADADGMNRPKEIQKEGLSEYYIYSVEGTETIPNGWSKRLRSFEAKGIPLETVYRLEPAKFGPYFTKVLEFKNDEEHKLGKEPLPDGMIRLYRNAGAGRLAWMGELVSKYIPKKEEVKINVGPDAGCTLKAQRLSHKKIDLSFRDGWIAGWTTVEQFTLEVRNFRGREVQVEIHQSFAGDFDFASEDKFEKHDANTQKIRFTLGAGETRKLAYTVTTRHGTNSRR
jgi:hypothetical protein